MRTSTLALFLVLGTVEPALAQTESHWGVTAGFVPQWSMPASFGELLSFETSALQGKDFQAGVVRGRDGGSDWGIIYSRQSANGRLDQSLLFSPESNGEFLINSGGHYEYDIFAFRPRVSGRTVRTVTTRTWRTDQGRVSVFESDSGAVGCFSGSCGGSSEGFSFPRQTLVWKMAFGD
jgi:hypothetical protein